MGIRDCLQNYGRAGQYYLKAAKLGCLEAYACVGKMYLAGEGVDEDINKAFELFEMGADRGSAYCHWRMAMVYKQLAHRSNAEMCFARFIGDRHNVLPDGQRLTEREIGEVAADCAVMIAASLEHDAPIPTVLQPLIRELAGDVLKSAEVSLSVSLQWDRAMQKAARSAPSLALRTPSAERHERVIRHVLSLRQDLVMGDIGLPSPSS